MISKKIIIYIVFTLMASCLLCQNSDNIWLIGGGSSNSVDQYGNQWGTTIMDFNTDPVEVYYNEKVTLDMAGTNASVCDKEGNLMACCNGMFVHSGLHKSISGLDTIAYSEYWENFNYKEYLPDGSDWPSGFPAQQAALFLPRPGSSNNYILMYNFREQIPNDQDEYSNETKILIAEIEIDQGHPEGKTLYKDSLLLGGRFNTSLNAVRHANGRDWWVIVQSEYNTTYFVFLLDPSGFRLIHEYKEATPISSEISLARAYFSPNGSKYVIAESQGDLIEKLFLTIYNFDRCNGVLSFNEFKGLPNFITRGSIAFSPDSKYLYVANGLNMYQYNLQEDPILDSEKIIDTWDGSVFKYNEFDWGRDLSFGYMVNGPDGRIYNTAPGGVRSLHTIEYPEEDGAAATVIQNKITLPTQNFNSIPNFPHYRLGPIDGSSCDTLGINNDPIAKFRYEVDTTDHLNVRFTDLSYYEPNSWYWTFGDGTSFSDKKPYWHRFPQGGEYEVCLTVSNENSENTTCRLLNVGGTVATKDVALNNFVLIYPNPVESDLLITLSEYIPAEGRVEIYDMLGQLVKTQSIYYGWNKVNVLNLANGTYVYRVFDGAKVLGEGKVVKVGR